MIQCNRGCDATGLHWRTPDGQFKLFDSDNLVHICNDGEVADTDIRTRVTDKLLKTLHLSDVDQIPCVENDPVPPAKKQISMLKTKPKNGYFTITSTATGIALTGDDKSNPIYLPKISVKELAKALFDFF